MRHQCDGRNAFIFDWDKRRLSGWSYSVKDGDEIAVPMESGKTALLRVKNLKRMNNPRDQYFADLEDVGYAEDCQELGYRLKKMNWLDRQLRFWRSL